MEKITQKQIRRFNDTIRNWISPDGEDAFLVKVYSKDRIALMNIRDLIIAGKLESAGYAACDLDTLVRDQIPRDIYKIISSDNARDAEDTPTVSKDPNKNWDNDGIQFVRFIAEAEAAGAFSPRVIITMAESMDLTIHQVEDIMERAQKKWDKIKENT